MTPVAVLVLVVGVLVVLAVAAIALVLDARRRRPVPPRAGRPPPAEPIDSRRARQDPPTVRTPGGRHAERAESGQWPGAEEPTGPIERASPRPRPGPRAPDP